MKILLILLSVLFTSCTFVTDPGSGKKIGKIVKVSQQGLFFKTWEAELIRGGLTDGSGTLGGTFHFTIEDDDIAKLADKFMQDGSDVIVTYHKEFISAVRRSEYWNPFFCDEIKLIEKNVR